MEATVIIIAVAIVLVILVVAVLGARRRRIALEESNRNASGRNPRACRDHPDWRPTGSGPRPTSSRPRRARASRRRAATARGRLAGMPMRTTSRPAGRSSSIPMWTSTAIRRGRSRPPRSRGRSSDLMNRPRPTRSPAHAPEMARVPFFDFDGTLVDSDVGPHRALARARRRPGPRAARAAARRGLRTRGRDRGGLPSHYDPAAALPFDGRRGAPAQLDRWGLASNKDRGVGPPRARAARVGARRGAVLRRLRRPGEGAGARCSTPWTSTPTTAVFVGDTAPRPRLRRARSALPFAARRLEPAGPRRRRGRRPRARPPARSAALLAADSELEHVLVGAA